MASADDIARFEACWRITAPEELKRFWQNWGTGRGVASADAQAHYLAIYSPSDALKAFGFEGDLEFTPQGFAPFGDNGSGEMIVYAEGHGFGLLPNVHSGPSDFVFIHETFEGFLLKTEENDWLPE